MWSYYLIILAAMGVAFYLGFKNKLPVGMVMVIAAAVGLLASGNGLPIRHMIEGSFFFFQLMLVIATSVLFITTLEASGSFDVLTRVLMYKLYNKPSILLCLLMLIIMLPAMLTGSAPVSMLSTGVLVAPILMRLGIPKIQTAAILAMGGLLGQSAPPINVMIMIIATSIFMPYEGFALPLAILCFPLAIFSVLYLGRKYVKVENLKEIVAELKKQEEEAVLHADQVAATSEEPAFVRTSFLPFLPLVVLTLLMAAPRIWPTWFVDPAAPFAFFASAVVALFTGRKIDIVEVSKTAMKKSLTVLGLFVGIGVLVQVLAFTGLRGFLAVASMSVPKQFLIPFVGITAPLACGPLVPFGASAVLGPPFVLAFTDKNAIIVSSAVSMFLSLGCLTPPTALSGLLGARIVGVENQYGKVFKACLVPVAITFVIALLFMYFANPIGQFLGV